MVLTAGTSDLPVAQEAVVTAKRLGCDVKLIADVGVAGIHRLLRHREQFAGADAIVVRSRHGARCRASWADWSIARHRRADQHRLRRRLPGLGALLTMLNACSANVVAVNIDSGFKGGYVAGADRPKGRNVRPLVKRAA